MNVSKIIVAAAVVAFSASSFAAKPRAIQFDSKFETEQGEKFAQYTVSCSNGKEMPLTEWQSPNQWCQGEGSLENCERRQMKAAKAACKAS